MLDGRIAESKLFQFIGSADILDNAVPLDWSGFFASDLARQAERLLHTSNRVSDFSAERAVERSGPSSDIWSIRRGIYPRLARTLGQVYGRGDRLWTAPRQLVSSPRFTPEFKEEAVRQVVERGYGVLNHPRFAGGSNSSEGGAITSKTPNKFASEVRERAVRMVHDHGGDYPSRGGAVVSIAEKIGCKPQTLHE